jgi:hypothetical protein
MPFSRFKVQACLRHALFKVGQTLDQRKPGKHWRSNLKPSTLNLEL